MFSVGDDKEWGTLVFRFLAVSSRKRKVPPLRSRCFAPVGIDRVISMIQDIRTASSVFGWGMMKMGHPCIPISTSAV